MWLRDVALRLSPNNKMCEKRINRTDNVHYLSSEGHGDTMLGPTGSHNRLYACLAIILGNIFVQLTSNGEL
jgi:hypothetical protein